SPLSSLPSPLFAVRTPTAIVTDLGTEFGVEVDENGNTTSHVFQGLVQVKILPSPASGRGAGGEGGVVQLAAGESVRASRVHAGTHHNSATGGIGSASGTLRFTHPTTTPKFVRRMIEPPKQLDLLDIVAGGDGLGVRRERGIDPATGQQDTFFAMGGKQYFGSDDYRRIEWHPLIDGIFVPKRNSKHIQLDSAGHTFDGFNFGTGGTAGSIWARAAEVSPINMKRNRWTWAYTMAPADKFMPGGGGLLCLHANTGITFDLAAMRKMHDGVRPSRFRATAGMAAPGPKLADPYGKADLWIFVDGRLVQSGKGVQIKDDAIDFDVKIGPDDRFLTIVSTDARNGCNFDWVVFGEPILEMTTMDP
ncbi:MAG: hypothetical protein JW959_06250, partial [Pirellulales bacterium]|nr:hypothetical protein [Pirellulales bacterium]